MNATRNVTRRGFIVGSAGLGLVSAAQPFVSGVAHAADPSPEASIYPEFPSQDPNVVREVVGASHTDLEKVRALVTARPALAKAAWDWGFGDWETALGAASHMGRQDIAGLLLENGATPTIFSAAMLGDLSVVRAFTEASPGIQRFPGPHGISLYRHAVAGGDPAQPVVAYLETLGDADLSPTTSPATPEELAAYVGTYAFGDGSDERLEVSVDKNGKLRLARGDRSARVLFPVGDHAFFPSGASAVRIRFAMEGTRASTLTVLDPDPVLVARRG